MASRIDILTARASSPPVDRPDYEPFVDDSDSEGPQATTAESAEVQTPADSNAIVERISRFVDSRGTPAILISVVFHTALLLLLALLVIDRQAHAPTSVDFVVEQTSEVLDANPTPLGMASGVEPAPPVEIVEPDMLPATTTTQASPAVALSELLKIPEPQSSDSETPAALSRLLEATSTSLSASFAATGVEGRSLQQRQQVALQRGGTLESEQAVERALDWLAAHQLPSGGWSLIHDGGECNGRCANNGVKDRFDPAATGLSLLAFLGAGYTHKEGKHRETVRKGVYFLQQIMEETPQGGSFLYQSERGMYNHGIAAFALCEAYQLTRDKDLVRPAQLAIDFITNAQNYLGGWGYLPKQPGDLTLSGWQIMALKSGYAAGLDVPPVVILRIDTFLDSQQMESGVFFGYGKPGKSSTCTSIGQMLRLFRGRPHTDPRVLEAADYFTRHGPSNSDAYLNYYATLFLFHVGQPFWDQWHPRVRDHLVSTQATSGHELGSWFFENAYGREGGRLYTTAMCAMTLEVYYRFSPLYQQADVKFEL